ncbi:hypothetical protein [Frankia sp. R82]|uniref:hypothetical protein n=1 Tax=Frankia sp. R82 TaxID=2950553 RepID=UPI0020431466|nr:hypothetical protein [Frankia sp. R82]MCM3884140.1 hypothetical protein [Frankia sp. R82]
MADHPLSALLAENDQLHAENARLREALSAANRTIKVLANGRDTTPVLPSALPTPPGGAGGATPPAGALGGSAPRPEPTSEPAR